MPSNKDRLYVTLHARGGASYNHVGENRYHWALLVGPKNETDGTMGVRFHAKNSNPPTTPRTWVFEEADSTLKPNNAQLVRIVISKVKNSVRLLEALRSVAVVQGDPDWNCISWVRAALEAVWRDPKALGTGLKDWESVKMCALDYVQKKKDQHRFDGKAPPGRFDVYKAATYDALQRREIVE